MTTNRVIVSITALLIALAVLPADAQSNAQKKTSTAEVRVVNVEAVAGRNVVVPIELESAGDVGAVIFSFNWDPSAFTYVSSALTDQAPRSTTLTQNTQPQHLTAGRMGVLMDTTAPFEKGKKTVLNITFAVSTEAAPRDYQFTFSATPAIQSVSTVDAQLVQTKFTPGTAKITPARRSVTGRILNTARFGIRGASVTLTGPDGKTLTTKTNTFGWFVFDNLAEGTYTINAKSRGYTFSPKTVEARVNSIESEFQEAT